VAFELSREEQTVMDLEQDQKRIDQVSWYHEFTFPNGLVARTTSNPWFHRRSWKFTREQLDKIDFSGKTVLDIGCWDGYWSFYAEERGATRVLATDDASQNWAGSAGLLLAKELLGSNVETRMDVSVYDLSSIVESVDIILCLGVYYHLVDPFYAFAEIRKRCHSKTLLVLQGDTSTGLRGSYAYWDPSDPALSVFVPHPNVLSQMLRAAYFEVVHQTSMVKAPLFNWLEYAYFARRVVRPKYRRLPVNWNRTITICRPITGHNALHTYPPPFGLTQYDPRWG
jgi:tRNA (mo5U34)-methyltransferase